MIGLAAPRQVSLFFSDMAGFTSLSVLQAFIRWQVYTVVDVCCKSHRNELLYVSAQNLWLMMENDVTGVIAQSCCKSSPCCEIMLSNGVHFNFHSVNMSFLLSLSVSALWFRGLDVLACTLFQPTRYCGAAGSGADTSAFEPLFQWYVQNVSWPNTVFFCNISPSGCPGPNPVMIQQCWQNCYRSKFILFKTFKAPEKSPWPNLRIESFDGVVIEYIGDAILAVFGAPAKLRDHVPCLSFSWGSWWSWWWQWCK